MEIVTIDFEMNSQDTRVRFTTTGEYDNQRIKFIDNESSTHEILLNGDIINYQKNGLMEMKFIFDINNVTKGIYKVDNNPFVFDIVTTKLENIDNRIVIEYELKQSNEIINVSNLVIQYSIAKEE